MTKLRDVAKLTKKWGIRAMALEVFYAGDISTRELIRRVKEMAKPMKPDDLQPDGQIQTGQHFFGWDDAGGGTWRQAESFDFWLYSQSDPNTPVQLKVDPKQAYPTWFFDYAGARYAFSVRARNKFGVSAEVVQDFQVAATGGSSPPPPPPPAPTFSTIAFQNCSPDHHTLHLYLQDLTVNGPWKEVASLDAQYDDSGYCPASAPTMVPLTDGHVYNWVLVDPQAIGCGKNDPNTYACRVWGGTNLHASAGGGVFSVAFPPV